MPKNITGRVGYYNGSTTFVPITGAKIYLLPSRNDVFVLNSSSWDPWEQNPNSLPYQNAIQVVTNGSGVWSIPNVWFTDTEVSVATPEPSFAWIIIDPNAPGGSKVYRGSFLSTLPAGDITLQDLVANQGWTVSGSIQTVTGDRNAQYGSFSFAMGSSQQAVAFASPFPNTPTDIEGGNVVDSDGSVKAWGVVPGSLTKDGFTAQLQGSAAAQLTAYFRAYG